MLDTTITYYGERGIVNGIILDIKDDIEKQRSFLKAIKLADKSNLPWANDAVHFNWFIEPSLSEFGSPDIILTVTTNTTIKYAFFIEAKLNSYDRSSFSLKDLMLKKDYDGVASKLNVQLAFKYRFVEAMFVDDKPSGNIEESEEAANKYKDNKYRKLKLHKLCTHMKKLFEGVDKNNIYYIALTNDDISLDPFDNKDTLPAITIADWEENSNKFGILTYQSLETMGVINRDSGVYGKAAEFMFKTLTDTERMDYVDEQALENINFQNWPLPQKNLADYAKKIIENTINNLKIEKTIIRKDNEGSYSYEDRRDNRKIVLKIQLYKNSKDKHSKENIIIGLREDDVSEKLEHTSERALYLLGAANRKPFWCYSVNNEDDMDRLSDVIEKYLAARITQQ